MGEGYKIIHENPLVAILVDLQLPSIKKLKKSTNPPPQKTPKKSLEKFSVNLKKSISVSQKSIYQRTKKTHFKIE